MHRKRFIGNTVFLLGGGVVAQLIGLLVLPLFIKNLGEQEYGLFVISSLLIGYSGVFDLGFTDGLTRQVGRAYSSNDRRALSEAVCIGFFILCGIGILSGSLIYFGRFGIVAFLGVAESDHDSAIELISATAALAVLRWPAQLPHVVLKGALRLKALSVTKCIGSICSSCTMLALVLMTSDLVTIRLSVGVVTLASAVPMLFLVKKYVPELTFLPLRFRWATFSEMSRFSIGMFYSRILSVLSNRMDHVIIGGALGVASISPYMVAFKLFEALSSNTQKLFAAFLPTVFSLDKDTERKRLQSLLDHGVRYRALIITPLAYVGVVFSPAFIRVWMGAEYESVAIWSQLFMIPPLANVFGVGVNVARGMGKLRFCNILFSIRAIVNLVISVLLVKHFGIGGPIIGTIFASVFFGDAIVFPFVCRMCHLEWRHTLRQGMAIVLVNLPLAVVATVVISRLQIVTWPALIGTALVLLALFYGTLWLCFIGSREKHDLFLVFEATGLTKIPAANLILSKLLL